MNSYLCKGNYMKTYKTYYVYPSALDCFMKYSILVYQLFVMYNTKTWGSVKENCFLIDS